MAASTAPLGSEMNTSHAMNATEIAVSAEMSSVGFVRKKSELIVVPITCNKRHVGSECSAFNAVRKRARATANEKKTTKTKTKNTSRNRTGHVKRKEFCKRIIRLVSVRRRAEHRMQRAIGRVRDATNDRSHAERGEDSRAATAERGVCVRF